VVPTLVENPNVLVVSKDDYGILNDHLVTEATTRPLFTKTTYTANSIVGPRLVSVHITPL